MLLAVSFLAAALVLGASAPTPTATPTVPPTRTPTATPSVLPTLTLTPTLEPSPTATATPTIGLPPTPTAAPTAPAYTPPPAGLPASQLPQTAPGLSRDEGTFLITAADDGSRAVYFIAGNARHSVLAADLQLEMQLNPLWPVRQASRDEVLSIVEGTPVGSARAGLLSGPLVASDAELETTISSQPAGASQPAAQPIADTAAAQQPLADTAAAQLPSVETAAAQPILEAPAVQPSIPEAPALETTYVVQTGDNLTRIAERYHASVQAILAANQITNANLVFVGKALVIPSASDTSAPATAEVPPTLADTPQDAAVAPTRYTVRAGDSAIGIARQFGVDLDTLLSTNQVADRNRVYVGQVLTIPAASS